MINLNLNLNFNLFKKEENIIKFSNFKDFADEVHNKKKGFYNLADFQLEMAYWRLKNIENTSLLLATRGIGKSDIITCLTSLYIIYQNPTQSIIIITDKATKGRRLLKYIKDIIINNNIIFLILM